MVQAGNLRPAYLLYADHQTDDKSHHIDHRLGSNSLYRLTIVPKQVALQLAPALGCNPAVPFHSL